MNVMKKGDVVVFTGESDHCLLNTDGKILPLNDKKVEKLTRRIQDLIDSKE